MAARLDARTLHALVGKYEAMERLAAEPPAHEAGPYAARRRLEKKALADAFPGALRELDTLGVATLRERAACVRRVRDAGLAPPDWLLWITRFHALLRVALAKRAQTPAPAEPLKTRKSRKAAITTVAGFSRKTLDSRIRLPGGRQETSGASGKVAETLAAIAEEEGVSVEAVRGALFPAPLFPEVPSTEEP